MSVSISAGHSYIREHEICNCEVKLYYSPPQQDKTVKA